ncbi:class I SAM-dependent methyltransferase [Alkalicoccobacillus gibsonii]|uniref:class I SAM-dependent methyltransferase n=1 Tax=Alkalicoccobacillus gibsonii TaxID=79881 RepID=UPI00193138AF|nr:class I SAM-dependent methyltransferase [Alkalicoccobacillus gibsonii]MBM0066525.1 methyltransferase domain-containing protein [Alkalicoccobacillus gibsonii]
MENKFDQLENQFTYAERTAHQEWIELILSKVKLEGKRVADIGCGGGIYTRMLAEFGPHSVLGVDSSKRMLEAAQEKTMSDTIEYVYADGENLAPLPDGSLDIVVERAVIHHLSELLPNMKEISRVLSQEDGVAIIQDRTPEDCLIEGTSTHIRGYLFECFPFLAETEKTRRFSDEAVQKAMMKAGFKRVERVELWETRSVYSTMNELAEDLQSRRGRTILHELSDEQLTNFVNYVSSKLPQDQEIIEKDRWSIWFGFRN